MDPQLASALAQGLMVSLIVGLALAAIWGTWLVVSPDPALRFSAVADRWVATDGLLEHLNRPINSTRLFYRYHRWTGSLVALGAAYGLARWYLAYDRAAVLSLDPDFATYELGWLVAGIECTFVVFNALIVVFGLIVVFRPSLLKEFERWANRWVRVRAPALDRRFDPLAKAVSGHPRMLGSIIAIVSALLVWRLLTIGA